MAPPKTKDSDILDALEIYRQYGGNVTLAAQAVGKPRSSFQHYIHEARARGLGKEIFAELDRPKFVVKGESLLHNGSGDLEAKWTKTKLAGRESDAVEHVPDPKRAVRISTLYDQQGKVAQQWITEKPEDTQREHMWRELAADLAKDIPRAKPMPLPKGYAHDDLLAGYPVGDHHTGMMAWPLETGGAAYDLKIAEEIIRESALRLIGTCPPCKQAILPFLGDFFHYDSYAAVTPAHKNLLDADGRYPKMVEVGIRSIRHIITAALERHHHLTVIFKGGNHDPSTSACIRIFLACLYENEPRVTVDTSPMDYSYFEFGKNLLGFHHGDKTKLDRLPSLMAHDQAEAWGRTEFRLWMTGHVHKETRLEFPGCSVETFPVLPPLDAYAAGAGYRSKQQMKAIVFHREHGEVERHTVNPGMFERKAA